MPRWLGESSHASLNSIRPLTNPVYDALNMGNQAPYTMVALFAVTVSAALVTIIVLDTGVAAA